MGDQQDPLAAQRQFGRQARYYAESLPHRSGESLQLLAEYAARGRYRWAVDIGTGAGYTACAIAPYAERALATDITLPMLHLTRRLARERGLTNLAWVLAAAESLPFADASLDLVACRTAAHHFTQVEQAVAQWRRVLVPGGVLLLADTVAPEDPEVARWMHEVEVRRDPSHQRNLSPSQWLALLRRHGFQPTDMALTRVELEFHDWVRRSGTPPEEVERLRHAFFHAPPGAVAAFRIQLRDDGTIPFAWDCLVVRALRP